MIHDGKNSILLVEDDRITAKRTQTQLEKKGYAVYHAAAGEDAVQIILENTNPIDLILMDIDLGSGIDGTQAAEQILDRKDLPVVFLSSHTEPEIVEKTEKITSYGYVVKTSGIVVLEASIKMALRLFGSRAAEKKQKEVLRAAANRYETTLEALDEAVFLLLPSTWKPIACNAAATEIFGYSREELTGQAIDILHLDREQFEQFGQDALAAFDDPGYYITEFKMQRKDSSVFASENYVRPLRDQDGGTLYLVSVVRDITERKMAETEFKIFKTISDNAVYGKAIADLQGNLQYVNRFFAQVHGYEPADLIGKHFSLFHNEQQIGAADRLIASTMQEGKFAPATVWHCHRDGSEFPMLMSGILVRDDFGMPQYIAASAIDMTDQFAAEQALHKSEERYRTISEDMPVLVCRFLPDYTISYVNRAYCEYFGRSEDDLLGVSFLTLIPESEHDAVTTSIAALTLDAPVVTLEVRAILPDRTVAWQKWIDRALFNETGAVIAYQAIGEDITERKQAEGYREMGQEILWILNEPGEVQGSIKRVLAVLKAWTGVDAVGLRLQEGEDFPYFIQDGFSDDFLQTENSLVERNRDGGLCRDEHGNVRLECTCGLIISGKIDPSSPLFTKGGSFWTNDFYPFLNLPRDQDPRLNPRNKCIHTGYASAALIPVRTGERIVGLIQLNDRRKDRFSPETIEILEGIAAHIGSALMRRQAEEELVAANQEAEMLREKAEAANRAKSMFIANMSHEIRTPLNSIIGFTDLLRETELTAEQQQDVNNIITSGHLLMSIITDILDFSKIEAGMMQLDLVKTDLIELLMSIMHIFEIESERKGLDLRLTIDPDMPRFAVVDPVRLKQVLANLLGNAVKFTQKGKIELSVSCQPLENQQWNFFFSVRDTGIGITEAQKEKLFKAFSQADSSTTREFGGTGLGLIISRMIVQKMNGRIDFESSPGAGSVFFFDFPAEAEYGERLADSVDTDTPEKAVMPSNARILIVEDDKTNKVLLKKMLTRLLPGARLFEAATGAEALEVYGDTQPDIILTDVQMPEMGGIEAAEAIRNLEDGTGRHVYITALTAGVSHTVRDKCLAAGMDAFLTKPVTFEQLRLELNRAADIMNRSATDPRTNPAGFSSDTASKTDSRELRTAAENLMFSIEEYIDIAEVFLEKSDEVIESLLAACAAKDPSVLAARAHKLTGMAHNMRFTRLANFAEKLENAARADSCAGCEHNISNITDEIYDITTAIDLLKEEATI